MNEVVAAFIVWITLGVYGVILALMGAYFLKKLLKKRAKPRGELVRMSDYRHTRNK